MSTLGPNATEKEDPFRILRDRIGTGLLRLFSLVGRFVLVMYLAQALSGNDLGVFAIMVTTITIAIYLLGLEYHVCNLRRIVGQPKDQQAKCIREQIAVQTLGYLVQLPLWGLVFVFNLLPLEAAPWFYGLAILEQISQECYRLLCTLTRPIAANIVLFFRNAAWIYLLIGYRIISGYETTLVQVWVFWLCGVATSVVLAGFLLWDRIRQPVWDTPIDWQRIGAGLRVSLIYLLIATVSLVSAYSGRYFLQATCGEQPTGVYFFYASMGGVVQTLTEAGSLTVLLARLVAAAQHQELARYRGLFRQLIVGTLGTAVIVSVGMYFTLWPILSLLNRPHISEQYHLFPLILFAVVLNCASLLPNTVLFVHRRDWQILASECIGMVVAVVANYFLIQRMQLAGAAWAAILSGSVLLIAKLIWAATPDTKRPS